MNKLKLTLTLILALTISLALSPEKSYAGAYCSSGETCIYSGPIYGTNIIVPPLLLNGATSQTANVIGLTNSAALGSVLDYSTLRVQTAPISSTATGVAFGTYSTVTNTTTTTGTTAHMVGVMGNVTDSTTSRITMYGVEGRADARSTVGGATHDYFGGTFRALFQGASLSSSTWIVGAESFCNITTDGSTPLAEGVCLGHYIPAGVGGVARYGLYVEADSIFAGGGIDVQDLNDTTITRTAAGTLAVEGAVIAELSTAQTWSAVQTNSVVNVSASPITTVANVGANSCGTTSATPAGTSDAGGFVVGATSGTQCRVTFSVAAPNRRVCIANNETTTANKVSAVYVSTTTTDFLGTFVGGDIVTWQCRVY